MDDDVKDEPVVGVDTGDGEDKSVTTVVLDPNMPMLNIGHDLVAHQKREAEHKHAREHYKRFTGKRPGRLGRNDKCHCKSGLKFKKCCGARSGRRQAAPRQQQLDIAPIDLDLVTESDQDAVVAAMTNAGVHPATIYAYKKTGLFLTEASLTSHSAEDAKLWSDAVMEYTENHGENADDTEEDASENGVTEAGADAAG